MTCPICKSDRVSVELRSAGTTSSTNYYRTGVKSSWFIPSGQKTRTSKQKYKSMAICQNCGYHWEADANSSLAGCLGRLIGYILGLAILIAIVLVPLKACTKPTSDRSNNDMVADPQESSSKTSVWASEYTPLSEFEYYIEDEAIYLKDYDGKSKTVYIASSYTYDDRSLPVVAIVGSHFFPSVDSIIISEGIAEIEYAAFNGCGVKNLYLPSTLTDFSGWSYFHNVEKLYYGGDKDAWAALFSGDRSRLDVVEVVCNASISDLLAAG